MWIPKKKVVTVDNEGYQVVKGPGQPDTYEPAQVDTGNTFTVLADEVLEMEDEGVQGRDDCTEDHDEEGSLLP